MLCSSSCAIGINKNLVVKVTFLCPGPYKGFYDMGYNSIIACSDQTKFGGREVQDDKN